MSNNNGCGCGHHGKEPKSEVQKQFQNLLYEYFRMKELSLQNYNIALQSNEELRAENEALRDALRKNDAVGQ
jgi:hypothetical protein